MAGDPGALEPLKDERLEDGRSYEVGGGNITEGVLGTEVDGVSKALCWEPEAEARLSSLTSSLALVMTDSVSLAVDSRRAGLGRLCELAVRLWRWDIRVFFPMACTSRDPDLSTML